MPDPVWKHFGYGRLWPLCSKNRAGSWSNFLHLIQFHFFPKKAWLILCKTDAELIWMSWSGFGQTHLIWKQAGVQEPLVPNSGRTPLSDLVTFFHRRPESHCAKPAGSNLVLADCIRFWPNGSGPETNWPPTIIGPASGLRFPANLDQMPIRSGMFTGQLHCCQCLHRSAQWSHIEMGSKHVQLSISCFAVSLKSNDGGGCKCHPTGWFTTSAGFNNVLQQVNYMWQEHMSLFKCGEQRHIIHIHIKVIDNRHWTS